VGLAPAALVLGVAVSPVFFAGFLAYPAQAARLFARYRRDGAGAGPRAALTVIGKVAEAKGVLTYFLRRFGGGRRTLIEYK
jgi:hypothetical protein